MARWSRRKAASGCCGDPGHRIRPAGRQTFGSMKSQSMSKWMRFGLVCLICIGLAYGIALLIGTD